MNEVRYFKKEFQRRLEHLLAFVRVYNTSCALNIEGDCEMYYKRIIKELEQEVNDREPV